MRHPLLRHERALAARGRPAADALRPSARNAGSEVAHRGDM